MSASHQKKLIQEICCEHKQSLCTHFPKNSKVLLRVDFNVPMKNNKILDASRISLSLPTIDKLLQNNNAVILISHLGRPNGLDKKFSLKPIKDYLQLIFKTRNILFCESFEELELKKKKESLQLGEILLLENLRFDSGEKKSNLDFAKKLSQQIHFFINDAFAVCHRTDCSVTQIPTLFKHKKMAGLLLQKEILEITKVINSKKKKVAIIGGMKISTKIGLIKSLLNNCNDIIIGGAMAFSFIKYLNGSIGLSLYEESELNEVGNILKKAKKNNCNIHLPIDVVTVKKNVKNKTYYRDSTKIPDNEMGLDIGPHSCDLFKSIIAKNEITIWNGPMGMFEDPNFQMGTQKIATAISDAYQQTQKWSLVGGGDTLSAINTFNYSHKSGVSFGFVSSGGGAMLAFLENQNLPGIIALRND